MIIRSLASCRFLDVVNSCRNDKGHSAARRDPLIGRINSPQHQLPQQRFGFSSPSLVMCESVNTNYDQTSKNQTGSNSVLFDLIRSGSIREIKELIKKTNLRETDDDSWTCLHWAVEMGHRDLVEIFLDADPLLLNMKTREGLSCINIAAWRGDDKMVQLLLQQGSEIDDKTKWGETPLHHAVTFGHAKVCEILLKAGADAHSEDRLKRTPYQIAMQKGTKQVRKILSQYPPKSE